jgi:NADH-quinone oxidoreductase subunit J
MMAALVPVVGAVVAQNVFFYLIAAVMVIAALRVVTTSNIVHAALYLVVVLAGVAAQFILLGAEFVGVTQVLVYIGAVIVLFLFGIMLTRAKVGAEDGLNHDNLAPPILTAVLLFLVMGYAVFDFAGDDEIDVLGNRPTTVEEVADAIFKDYIVAFEAISVLLLAALIGAIVVARKE